MVAISRGRSRSRAVLAVNAAVTVVVVVLVAAVALVVRAPSPPGIAEFAPQAAKPITKAPPGQNGRFGAGNGACAPGLACANGRHGTAGIAAALGQHGGGAPSALQCFTWPDGAVTQTFDPQSPPCIASWPGAARGNGGATAPGVTTAAIKVAFPAVPASYGATAAKLQPLVDFINSHFELYGRSIALVPFQSEQGASAANNQTYIDPTLQHADAVQAASLHPFAALDFVDPIPTALAGPAYLDTLASKRVIALTGGDPPPLLSKGELPAHAPYEWSYLPTGADLFANLAAMTCRQLVGHVAAYASAYAGTTRKFALVIPREQDTGGAMPGVSDLLSSLQHCGAGKVPVIYYAINATSSDDSALSASLNQARLQGVTSLIFFEGWTSGPHSPMGMASQVGYHPEWVTAGWEPDEVAENGVFYAPDEMLSTFGVGNWNKLGPLAATPWAQSFLAGGGSQGDLQAVSDGADVYHELLMLASGAQMAGPKLTPTTFAAALNSTTFPDPGAAAPPTYQATVGFHEGVMVRDFNAFWMDPRTNKAAQLQGVGSWDPYESFCYVDAGKRWTMATWPKSSGFYSGNGCR
jgi:hypothetical protein